MGAPHAFRPGSHPSSARFNPERAHSSASRMEYTAALAYMWKPDFTQLLSAKTWLEAAGQIFFTLSVGIGVILTYASYLKNRMMWCVPV